jgi:hypothetical protein
MILYQLILRGPSRTYMTESLQSPYLPISGGGHNKIEV